jgi:outer membrane lipoprotein-sorting protein
MNKYLRYVLPAIALLILVNASAADASAQQVREIINRMDANNRALKSLRSKVQMAKTDFVLKETDLKEGELFYVPGRSQNQVYLRINWQKPADEQLAIRNGEYVLYTPGRKQAITGKVDGVNKNSKAGGILSFMSMSKAQLSASYDVQLAGEETVKSGERTWRLILTPKTSSSFKSADLWVDANGMPVQAKIVEKNNDSTTILLSSVQRNATLNASVFKISPPGDTKIVKG